MGEEERKNNSIEVVSYAFALLYTPFSEVLGTKGARYKND